MAFFWSLHIFCFEHVVARRGGFLLEASVSADYCLVSQKLFRPLQSPPTLDSLYPCSVLNFCELLNYSKLRNHPDLAVFSVKNHPSWKSKEVCTHSYIVSIRRKFKTFLSYHSSLIRSVYLPVAVFIRASFYFDLRGLTCMYTLNWIAMAMMISKRIENPCQSENLVHIDFDLFYACL